MFWYCIHLMNTIYYKGDQISEYEMGRACSMLGTDEKCIQIVR